MGITCGVIARKNSRQTANQNPTLLDLATACFLTAGSPRPCFATGFASQAKNARAFVGGSIVTISATEAVLLAGAQNQRATGKSSPETTDSSLRLAALSDFADTVCGIRTANTPESRSNPESPGWRAAPQPAPAAAWADVDRFLLAFASHKGRRCLPSPLPPAFPEFCLSRSCGTISGCSARRGSSCAVPSALPCSAFESCEPRPTAPRAGEKPISRTDQLCLQGHELRHERIWSGSPCREAIEAVRRRTLC